MKKSSKTKKAWIVTLCVTVYLLTAGVIVYAASSYFGNKYKQNSYDDILYRSEWNNLMDDLDSLSCPSCPACNSCCPACPSTPQPGVTYQNPDKSTRSTAPVEGTLYTYDGTIRGSIAEPVRGSQVFGETYLKGANPVTEQLKLKNWCEKNWSVSDIPSIWQNHGNLCFTCSTRNCSEYTASYYYVAVNGEWYSSSNIACIHPNTNQYAVLAGLYDTGVPTTK